MISTNQFKNGICLVFDGQLYTLIEFQHVKPGKGGAFVRTKIRHLDSGRVLERTFKAGDKIEDAFIETRKMQFLYRAGNDYHFMDQQSYEQQSFEESLISHEAPYLKENMEVIASFHNGKLVGLVPPTFVILKVAQTDPGLRGDTSKSGTKMAKMESGLTLQVPLFINEGDLLKIDTRSGNYIERASA